ncbi:MAG: entericidin A/B family lipoprotein [Halothiobacillaceae bacterium]
MRNRLVIAALLMMLAGGLLTGCSTVEGFGKDVEKGGQAIERAANGNSAP